MSMTASEEARFIQLWLQGASYAALAKAFGCPLGTVGSRAYALVRQGKIQSRPKGGSYPRRKAQGRQPLALADRMESPPVQTSVQRPVHNSVHTPLDQPPAPPDLSGVLNSLVARLSAIEETLKQGGVHSYAPVQDYAPVPNYALPSVEPPRLSAEDRKSERWNLYMPRWIRQRIERAAAREGMSPSQFLQRLCGPWAATWHDPEGAP